MENIMNPRRTTELDAVLSSSAPTKAEFSEAKKLLKEWPYLYNVSREGPNTNPLVTAMMKAGEAARSGNKNMAEEYIKLAQAIIKIHDTAGNVHSLFTKGTDGKTVLDIAANIGLDNQVPSAIRSKMQDMTIDLMSRAGATLENKTDAGMRFTQNLPAQVDNKFAAKLTETLLKLSTNFGKHNSITAIRLIADLNESQPQIVKAVLASNVKLLNKSDKSDIDPVTLPMQIIKFAHFAEDREPLYKLLNAALDTKGYKINQKVGKETLYSLTFYNASESYFRKPEYKRNDSEAREKMAKEFQGIALDLIKRGAQPIGQSIADAVTMKYDTSWLAAANAEKVKSQMPIVNEKAKPQVVEIIPPIVNEKPKPVAVEITVPPPATAAPVITRVDSIISEKNLKKLESTLKNSDWEIDRKPQQDMSAKPPVYLNVTNKNNAAENFQIYRDKISTSSHSVETYVAMLQTFKETYPGKVPTMSMSNPSFKANIEAALATVYPDKAANIKIIDRSAVAEKKQEAKSAPEEKKEEENEYKSPGMGRR
jgi:hypothetical protein